MTEVEAEAAAVPACAPLFQIPVGESRWPFVVAATHSACSDAAYMTDALVDRFACSPPEPEKWDQQRRL